MSSPELRKIPTDWLDYNDRKAAEEIATEASKRRLAGTSVRANDWEIIGISSGDMSPPLPQDLYNNNGGMSGTENRKRYSTTAAAMTDQQRSRQDGGIVLGLCGISRRIFAPVGYPEIGTGRFVGTRILLFIRLLALFLHGISAGFSYALRDKVSVNFLLSELFIWLHLTFLFLAPLLLLSSILTLRWNFLRESHEEEDFSGQGQYAWLTVAVLYQVVMVLAQTELARLLVMHWVPALRPIVTHEGTELVYSLTNPFAVQRYLMVASTMIDAILSTVPLRGENAFVALLAFIPWASVSLFSRPTASTNAGKIGYLCGFSILVLILTAVNVLIHRMFASCSQDRREQHIDKPKTTIDIV